MKTLVRRRHARITPNLVPYIQIEPNNGGIVLNISHEGLCFQSVAPIRRDGPVHFSFKEHNRQMSGCGELVWLTEAKKTGGLRFTSLTVEARDQVDEWIAQAPPTPESDDGSPSELAPEFDEGPTPSESPGSSLIPVAARIRLHIKANGFSTGLFTGLLISVIAAAIVVGFRHNQLDSRSRPASPELRSPSGSRAPDIRSTAASSEMHVRSSPVRNEQAEPSAPRKSVANVSDEATAQPLRGAETGRVAIPEQQRRLQQTLPGKSGSTLPASELPPVQQQFAIFGPLSTFVRKPASPFPKFQLAEGLDRQPVTTGAGHVEAADSTVHIFFDLGKYKDELSARQVSEDVTELGLSTEVVKRRFLWRTSYQVLVGPYSDQGEETRIQAKLASHGYKPRPFERGSRRLQFFSPLKLNRSRLPVGDALTITWESYVANASVRFLRGSDVIATARGKWVERPQKYSRDECVYVRDGSHNTLLEIHFSGQKRALVFRNAS